MPNPWLHLELKPASGAHITCVVCGLDHCDAEIPLPPVAGYTRTAAFGLHVKQRDGKPMQCADRLGKVTDEDGRTYPGTAKMPRR